MKFISWLILGLVAVVLILFAASNRESVSIALWPLPDALELPLYLVLLGVLVFGFVAGELMGWIRSWRWKREARRNRERVAVLERELEAERARSGTRPAAVAVTQ
jgi:lipopolysaccharide assembly protein A